MNKVSILASNLAFRGVLSLGALILGICIMSSENSQAEGKSTMVVISTSMGDMEVELNQEKAPTTVQNFLSYVDEKFYDGTIFHRVINGFMIQGGGFAPDMSQKKTHPPIKIESSNGLKNLRGTLAMARTNDPNSATSQFFINHKDNSFLDYRDSSAQGIGYAVFGKVVSGLDVVDKIANLKTGQKMGFGDVPMEMVEIKSVKKK